MKSYIIAIVSSLAVFAVAQDTQSDSGSYSDGTFNASQIDMATREMWCTTQVGQCPVFCGDSGLDTTTNDCYPENLAYNCVCSNGQRPNSKQYSEPIPYYLCTKAQSDCINKCNAIASCTDECRKQNTCGAQHPKPSNGTVANTTQTSTSSTSSSTPTASSANFNGKPSSAGPMLSAHVGTIYGAAAVVAVAVGALGGFGF
jgi:hypothetical protein